MKTMESTFRFVRYARPVIVSQLLMVAIGFTDTAILGLVGNKALSAGGLINSYLLLFSLIVTGFGVGILPLIAKASGMKNHTELHLYFRAGLVVFGFMGVLGCVLLLNLEHLLLIVRVPVDLLAGAETYQLLISLSFVLSAMAIFLRFYLIALDGAQKMDRIFFWAFLLNLFMNLLLTGHLINQISLGMAGVAVSTLLTNFAVLFLLVLEIKKMKPVELKLEQMLWRWPAAVFSLLSSGALMGSILGIEALLYTATHTLVAQLGEVYLAAHSWFLLVSSIIFMIPVGLAQAASTRLSKNLAADQLHPDLRPGFDALLAGASLPILLGLTVALIMHWSWPVQIDIGSAQQIIGSDPEALVRTVFVASTVYLPVIPTLSGLVVIVASILHSMEVKLRMQANIFIGYWFVGIGLSYVLLAYTDAHWQAVYIGLSAGFAYPLMNLIMTNRSHLSAIFGYVRD